MDYYISVALIAVSAILTCAASLPILKIIQLSGYKARGVVAWWKATGFDTLIRYIALTVFGFISMIVYLGCFSTFKYARYCAVALYVLLAVVFIFSVSRRNGAAVKFTPRMKRLYAADFIINLIIGALVAWAAWANAYCQTLAAVLGVAAPFAVIAANAVMSPIERANNGKYVKRAKAKLAEKKPVVIGITGSYGKTTAKNLLCGMLSRRYGVLATPGSFNTPMGVCMTVNNELNAQEVLIAEMGARYKGDIKELCGIVSPKYGIITAIGDMHLETLKDREGVMNAKFELGESLPQDGLLALNGYNEGCAALMSRQTSCRKEVTGEGAAVYYKDLKIDGSGTSFTLVIDGAEYSASTRLLGAHIAELACVCAVAARDLGVSADDIVAALEAAEPVEHRLQLLPGNVIDDAYNSNPVGAKNALDVLSLFDGKKIIITPGFVELGAVEKQSNTELGKQIAAVCDYAFLVGSRAEDIKKGAIEAGMPESVVHTFECRGQAVEALKDIAGDRVVLFENDLPDNIK